MVGLWTVWGERDHEFQLFGGLLEATEDGVHKGFFVHGVDLGIASSASGHPSSPKMAIEVGKLLLFQLFVKFLALLSFVNFSHYI